MQFISLSIVVLFVSLLLLFPNKGNETANLVFNWMTNTFDFAFLIIGLASLIFLLYIAMSKYGNIKLSADQDAKPEFSLLAWSAMVFLAGIASLILWGGTEWAFHYQAPPFGLDPKTNQMYVVSQAYGIFHWGPTAWALYAVPSIAIAYVYYIKKQDSYNISNSCRGVFGKYTDGILGKIINYSFIFGVIFAATTSLGLGTPMISGALAELLNIDDPKTLNIPLIILCSILFTISSGLGLKKGIKTFSIFGALLAVILVIYIFIVGPTKFMINLGLDSLGYLINNYIKMSTWTDSVEQNGFPQAWTIFYWAWWVSLAPFMGIFVTRISRGRTIREVILGMIGYGTLGCASFYMILGGYTVSLDINQVLNFDNLVNTKSIAPSIIEAFKTLPLSNLVLLVVAISGTILLATTFDSATYTVACASTNNIKEGQEPLKANRLFWCFVVAILPITLLIIGGNLKTIQTVAVITGLPLMFILLAMMVTIYKYLKKDIKK